MRFRNTFTIPEASNTPNTAVGISLPFNGPSVFNKNYSTKDQIKTNLINLLLTNTNERPFRPDFYVDLRSKVFDNKADFEFISEIITSKVKEFIPGININNIKVDTNSDKNVVYIKIDYSYNNNSDILTIAVQNQ